MTKLAVVMDPLNTINTKKDSTLAMLLEAQRRNWQIYFIEQKDLFIQDGIAFAYTQTIHIDLNQSPWYQLKEKQTLELAEFDIILMRKDPPFDMNYIYSTYILELAEQTGVLVSNKPQSLRDANEKVFTSLFPQCCPSSVISQDMTTLKEFLQQHEQVVFKPLDSMGGKSIFLVDKNNPNITVIIETLSHFGTTPMMAQQFIPEIKQQGDKRILLVNGEPIPYTLARIPAEGDIRGNLAAGATGKVVEINDRDRWICQQLAPTLQQKGLSFVGIDVIGDYLTEINVTSPTCLREIEAGCDINISQQLFDYLHSKCNI